MIHAAALDNQELVNKAIADYRPGGITWLTAPLKYVADFREPLIALQDADGESAELIVQLFKLHAAGVGPSPDMIERLEAAGGRMGTAIENLYAAAERFIYRTT